MEYITDWELPANQSKRFCAINHIKEIIRKLVNHYLLWTHAYTTLLYTTTYLIPRRILGKYPSLLGSFVTHWLSIQAQSMNQAAAVIESSQTSRKRICCTSTKASGIFRYNSTIMCVVHGGSQLFERASEVSEFTELFSLEDRYWLGIGTTPLHDHTFRTNYVRIMKKM